MLCILSVFEHSAVSEKIDKFFFFLKNIKMGQSTQQIFESETNLILLQYQHSFIYADVNATCFNLPLGHLQAHMKQQ
jgi:hypothetical protein